MDPNNLTTGRLVRENSDGSRCYCPLGLIALAAGFQACYDERESLVFDGIGDDYNELYSTESVHLLGAAIKEMTPELFKHRELVLGDYVYLFNDLNSTKHTDIVAAFNKAVELY